MINKWKEVRLNNGVTIKTLLHLFLTWHNLWTSVFHNIFSKQCFSEEGWVGRIVLKILGKERETSPHVRKLDIMIIIQAVILYPKAHYPLGFMGKSEVNRISIEACVTVSGSWFVIRDNLLNPKQPCTFTIYCYLFGVRLS